MQHLSQLDHYQDLQQEGNHNMWTLDNYKPELSNQDYYVFQKFDENGNLLETNNVGTGVGAVADALAIINTIPE